MFTFAAIVKLIVAVVPDTDVVLRTLLSAAFLTCTAVTPVATLYFTVAVVPEYVKLSGAVDSVGASYCFSNDCWADAGLSRPTPELSKATTTMFVFSVIVTLIVAVVPDTDVVTPVVRTLLLDAFLTCT